MPNIDEIIPKRVIDDIIKTDKAVTNLDVATKEYIETLINGNKALKKQGVTHKTVTKAQNKSVKSKKELTKVEKDQLAAEKALDRQRKKAATAVQKQIDAETKMNVALKKTVRSEQDLMDRTNALVRKRKLLDTTTKRGQKEFRKLSTEIKKNTLALKSNDKQISRFQRNVGNYKSALGGLKLGYIALAAVVAGAFRAMGKWMDAYDQQAKAEAKLLTALKGRSDIQKRLLNQATQLQRITLFGDEATIEAQAMLASLGLNEDAIIKLIPLVQDLATKSNMGLVQAADMVAKSVGSSTNALSRYGIVIEGAVGSSERLNSAVNAMNQQVGGQAEAAAKVGTGAVTSLKNAWGDLTEVIGKFVADPAMIAIINKLTDLFTITTKAEKIELFDTNRVINDVALASKSIEDLESLLERLNTDRDLFLHNMKTKTGEEKIFWGAQYDVARENIDKIQAAIDGFNKGGGGVIVKPEATKEQIDSFNTMLKSWESDLDESTDTMETEMQAFWASIAGGEEELTKMFADEWDKRIADNLEVLDAEKAAKDQAARDDKERTQIQQEYEAEVRALKIQLAYETVASLNEIFMASLEKERMDLEAQREYELNLTNGSREAEAVINEKYDKKKAKLQTEHAKKAKAAAIITTAINTAIAITAAYTTPPPPVGIALGLLMGLLGAVQIAAIAAQPIPKFYKGTESAPKGLLEVGEKGRELIETKSGKMFMANQPTITSGLQGAKIYSNPETERMIAGGKVGYDSIDLREVVQSNNRIEKAIRNKREFYYRADKRTITERKGKYYKTWMNANLGNG